MSLSPVKSNWHFALSLCAVSMSISQFPTQFTHDQHIHNTHIRTVGNISILHLPISFCLLWPISLITTIHCPLALGICYLLLGKQDGWKTKDSKIFACFDCRAFIVIISLTLSFSESDHFTNKDCVLFILPSPSANCWHLLDVCALCRFQIQFNQRIRLHITIHTLGLQAVAREYENNIPGYIVETGAKNNSDKINPGVKSTRG